MKTSDIFYKFARLSNQHSHQGLIATLMTIMNVTNHGFTPATEMLRTTEVSHQPKLILKDTLLETVDKLYQEAKAFDIKEMGHQAREKFKAISKLICEYEETTKDNLPEPLKKRLSEALSYEAQFISPLESNKVLALYEQALKYDPDNQLAQRKFRSTKIARGIIPVVKIYPEDRGDTPELK